MQSCEFILLYNIKVFYSSRYAKVPLLALFTPNSSHEEAVCFYPSFIYFFSTTYDNTSEAITPHKKYFHLNLLRSFLVYNCLSLALKIISSGYFLQSHLCLVSEQCLTVLFRS